MRQGPNGRRPRGRPNRKPHGGPQRPNNFDSGGPDGRVRGNAHQVYERYVGMARDALSAGDRVAAEAYYQHAEHYFRILNSSTDPESENRRAQRPDGNGRGDARREDNRRDDNRRDDNRRDGEARGSNGPEPGRASAGPENDGRPQRHAQDREPGPAAPAGSDQTAATSDGNAPTAETQDRQAAKPRDTGPRSGGEDREGLDRVLGNDTRPPRRQRQRSARAPEGDEAAARSERKGNGQGHETAPQDDAAAGSARSETPDDAAPEGKAPGTEPVGA